MEMAEGVKRRFYIGKYVKGLWNFYTSFMNSFYLANGTYDSVGIPLVNRTYGSVGIPMESHRNHRSLPKLISNNYTQTGGGCYNPHIQGVTIADGVGNINMGPVIGVGGIDQLGKKRTGPLGVALGKIHGISGGLSIVILFLIVSLCGYLFLPEGMV